MSAPELAALAAAALQPLDRAQGIPATELKPLVEEAERATVRLRNRLIELRRQQPDHTPYRTALRQCNVALSLIVGLGNPVGAIPWEYLGQAREILAALAGEGERPPRK